MKYKEGSSWELPPVETPYARAKRAWDDVLGSVVIRERRWRRLAYICMLLLLLQCGGLYYLASMRTNTPYFFSVNNLGDVLYTPKLGSLVHPDMALRKQIETFVEHIRGISTDEAVIKKNWLSLYDMATTQGAKELSRYYQELKPFKLAKSKRVSVQVMSAFRVTKETWQVDWVETETSLQQNSVRKSKWRGMFRVVEGLPQTREELLANPLGAYIEDFSWQIVEE